jgi:hypothetical protein
MSQPTGEHHHVSVGGSVGGHVVVGDHNRVIGNSGGVVTAEQLAAFKAAVDALKEKVIVDGSAPPLARAEAVAQIDALHTAATASTPDVSTMDKVRNWFVQHLPTFAGAVTGLLVHPVVGALVKASGDAVVEEFKRRFGHAPE